MIAIIFLLLKVVAVGKVIDKILRNSVMLFACRTVVLVINSVDVLSPVSSLGNNNNNY